jgi:hypothetical protein
MNELFESPAKALSFIRPVITIRKSTVSIGAILEQVPTSLTAGRSGMAYSGGNPINQTLVEEYWSNTTYVIQATTFNKRKYPMLFKRLRFPVIKADGSGLANSIGRAQPIQ